MLYHIAGFVLAYSMRGVIYNALYTVGEMIVTKVVDTTVVKTSKYVVNKLIGGAQTKKKDMIENGNMVDEGTETDVIIPIN